MRKVLSLLMILLLAVSLNGCSSNHKVLELLPEDADLSSAEDVLIKPNAPPYNLKRWKLYDTISWDVELPKDGTYEFSITYSRPGQYPDTWGIFQIETKTGDTYYTNFDVHPTGKDTDMSKKDWSVYVTQDGLKAALKAGNVRISIIPYSLDYDIPNYFINLRSITATVK